MQLSNFLLLIIFITTTLMCFSILNQNSTIKMLQRSLLNKNNNNSSPIILKEYIGKECELICPSISLIGQKGIIEEVDDEWVKIRFKKGKDNYKTQIIHILSIESIITD